MPRQINPPLPTTTHEHARTLRRNPTEAERKLWYHLRAGRLNGLKFRRRHPIPPYIVDFFCAAEMLVVELDGSQHDDEVDGIRTRFLESHELTVLRFWDNNVLTDLDAAIEAILHSVGTCPSPNPSALLSREVSCNTVNALKQKG